MIQVPVFPGHTPNNTNTYTDKQGGRKDKGKKKKTQKRRKNLESWLQS